jgi:OFA family oxalate/formate antiporter-like MFS transporter
MGTLLLLFLGLIYVWSIFVPPLKQEFGWSSSETALTFSLSMSMFCIGGVASGVLVKKIPARAVVILCALCVSSGLVLASRSDSLAGMYLSFGGIVGFGVGMGYTVIISTLLRWFPDRQGMISGIMMMGYGVSALLLSAVGTGLLETVGWRSTFLGLGIFYIFFISLLSFFIVPPPAGTTFPRPRHGAGKEREHGGDVPTGEMLRRRSFLLYFIWVTLLGAAGLTFIAHATPMALEMGFDPYWAALMTGLISLCNGTGRIVGGMAMDRLGWKIILPGICLGFALSGFLLFLSLSVGSMALLTFTCVLIGFSFGCVLPSNAACISVFYGMKHYPMNFSVANLNLLPASFAGPYIAGVLRDATRTYSSVSLVIVGFAVIAAAACLLIKKP